MPYDIEYYRTCGYITDENTVTDTLLDIETIIKVLNSSINKRIYVQGHGKSRIKSIHVDNSNIEHSYVVVGSSATIRVKFQDIIDADILNRRYLGKNGGKFPQTKDFSSSNGHYGARISEMIHHILKVNSPSP